jgi:hypothetical protein
VQGEGGEHGESHHGFKRDGDGSGETTDAVAERAPVTRCCGTSRAQTNGGLERGCSRERGEGGCGSLLRPGAGGGEGRSHVCGSGRGGHGGCCDRGASGGRLEMRAPTGGPGRSVTAGEERGRGNGHLAWLGWAAAQEGKRGEDWLGRPGIG